MIVVFNLGFKIDLPGKLKKYPDAQTLSLEIDLIDLGWN